MRDRERGIYTVNAMRAIRTTRITWAVHSLHSIYIHCPGGVTPASIYYSALLNVTTPEHNDWLPLQGSIGLSDEEYFMPQL
jgi:hypothetical protein